MHKKIPAALVACGLAAALTACGGSDKKSSSSGSSASGGGSITVAGFGGAYGDAEKAAYFDPFTKATGIKVNVLQAETTLGAVKLQVQKHNVVWDIAELPGPDTQTACDQGIIEKVDYKVVKKADLAPQGGYPCGILASLFAEGIGYSTSKFKTPPTWRDFFDTKKVPGKRTMEKYLTDGTLEYALIADGVPKDSLYPLDLKRAIAKLKTLGNDVVLVDSLAQASQLLTSGDAVMIQTAAGRILPLKNAGLPVDFAPVGERGEAIFTIPKGAKNSANAMKFLAYIASCASCSQQMARLTAYSGANKDGATGLPAAIKDQLPSSPKVVAQSFAQDDKWWSQNAGQAQSAFDAFLNG
jgi:putative spermidine/putrescine transport system substrate-binding protein